MRKELSIETRAKIVALRQAKLTFPQISKQLGLANPNTALSFYNTYCKRGSLESKKRCGRPKKQRNQTNVSLLERPRKTILQPVNSFRVSSIPPLKRRRYRLKQFNEFWGVENSSDELLQRKFFYGRNQGSNGWSGAQHGITGLELSDWKQYCFSDECRFKLRSDGRSKEVLADSNLNINPKNWSPVFGVGVDKKHSLEHASKHSFQTVFSRR